MRAFILITASLLFLLLFASCGNAQQFLPEDVIHTVGEYQLKFKHFLAYTNIELEGEDPALLANQEYINELTVECVDEFMDAPAKFIQEMDQHYEAMKMGAGFKIGDKGENQLNIEEQSTVQTEINHSNHYNTGEGRWKQLLSGNVLYTATTQSSGGLVVQNTQLLHLCPSGIAYNYSVSGGGGGFSGIDITALRQKNYEGTFNWDIIEQEGGMSFFQFSIQGASQTTPIKMVNNKIVIQGLGNFSLQQGGALCQ